MNQEIEAFFTQYADQFNKSLSGEQPDIAQIADCFASTFIESSPAGVICGNNDERFREKIPEGHAFYRQIGVSSMDILSKKPEMLNEMHAMCKIGWVCRYTGKDNRKGQIEFEVIYFLRKENTTWRIFGYITGDEQKALQEHGLINS